MPPMPTEPSAAGRLGIIAGAGDLPVRVAAAAGFASPPFVVVIAGERALADFAGFDAIECEIGAVGAIVDALRAAGCRQVALAGHVRRPRWQHLRPDWRGMKLLPRAMLAAGRGDDALLRLLVEYLTDEGFQVVGVEQIMAELLAPEGPVGRLLPDDAARQDIARGALVAAAIGQIGAGQAAVVRDGRVLALEAAEGTDAMLQRVAMLDPAGRGGVLVKRPMPGQDRRVDLPTVGARTVAAAAAARLAGIAVEAGGALIVDRAEVARAADAAGLFVVGFRP